MPEATYESEQAVSQYCEAHYGDAYFGVENFPVQCARLAVAYMQNRPRKRALDLGCAVGRAALELARSFDAVDGLDFSSRFIGIAMQLQAQGIVSYGLLEEGDIVSYKQRRLTDFGLEAVSGRVAFFKADATNLGPEHAGYDLILAANLIDRLYDPRKFLTTLHKRLNPRGILVLTSPYTWMEAFTLRENWVGGIHKDGQPYSTLDGLKDLLGDHFRMIDAPRDIEFVIRETRRKFQHTVSQMTVWERVV